MSENKNIAGNAVSDSLFGAIGGACIVLSGFLSSVIVARLLGADGLGVVAYVVWLMLMLTPLVDVGVASAVARYVPELRGAGRRPEADDLARRLFRTLGLAVFALAIACALIAAIPSLFHKIGVVELGRPLGLDDAETFAVVLAVLVGLQASALYYYAYLRGRRAFLKLAGFSSVSLLAQIVGVYAGGLFFGPVGALGGYAAGLAAPATAAIVFAFRTRAGAKADIQSLSRAWRYARFAWAANVANAFIWSRIEIFFLDRSWGPEAVGVFSVALALSSLATQGPILLTAGVLPMLAEKQGRGEFEQMKIACATGTRMLAFAVFPCCFGAAAITPTLIPLIYGPGFEQSVLPAVILAITAACTATTVVATNFVYAMERSDFIFMSSLVGAAFAVAAGFLLVPSFGVLGAAAARASIQIFMVAIGVWFIVRRLHCPLPFGSIVRLLLAAAMCAAVAGPVAYAAPQPFGLILAIPLGALAYAIGVRVLKALPASDASLLGKAVNSLPRPVRPAGVALAGALFR